jgi:N-methylhydantoinase A/oxoprolinase/acetone carboxylase beta subunit
MAITSLITEYAPVLAAFGALLAAVQAWRVSRNKPQVDEATAEKIKSEISKEQESAQQERALGNAKRDRYLVRLENWAYTKVRPAWHKAVVQNDEQNRLLVELAARAELEFTPKQLPELPDPPRFDDVE